MFSIMYDATLHDFFYILIFLLMGLLFAMIPIILPRFIAPRAISRLKETTYESGVPPIRTAWIQFGVSYYLFALIFLAFDVDVLYLLPVLTIYGSGGLTELLEVIIFLVILALAIVYAWRKGVFQWR
jgi:NADH-quinone oxidoreductase subunit A